MDQTDDSPINAILRRHLAAELDPQRGRAAGQFAARGLRRRAGADRRGSSWARPSPRRW